MTDQQIARMQSEIIATLLNTYGGDTLYFSSRTKHMWMYRNVNYKINILVTSAKIFSTLLELDIKYLNTLFRFYEYFLKTTDEKALRKKENIMSKYIPV